MGLTILIISAFTLIIIYNWLVGSRKTRLINKIPGPPTYPLVGNLFELIRPNEEIIPHAFELNKKYGQIHRLWAGPIPIVSLSSAEYVEKILSSNKELKKSFVYRFVQEWLGLGLLTSLGARWVKHRKMITPTFHFKILDSFVPVWESNSEVLVQKLAEKAKNNHVFDVYPYITLCALDMICETAMGINLHSQESTSSEYITAIYRLSNLVVQRINRVYLHPDIIYNLTPSGRETAQCLKTLHNFTRNVITERQQLRQTQNISRDNQESETGLKKRTAFLDLLLDAGSDLTVTDLREEVDTFMFAGHDTTTAGISWALYLLGRHPEIQEQVAEEVTSLWHSGDNLDQKTLSEMKLLERVLKETLRLYPSVPFISREIQEDMQFGEYLVPAHTTVSVAQVTLHMDEKVFPDPKKFDPDRFLPENVQKRHPYAYVPFSAGPRNCIGQKFAMLEEKTVVASIVRAFKIVAVEKEEDIISVSELIQRPKNGIQVKLTPRQ